MSICRTGCSIVNYAMKTQMVVDTANAKTLVYQEKKVIDVCLSGDAYFLCSLFTFRQRHEIATTTKYYYYLSVRTRNPNRNRIHIVMCGLDIMCSIEHHRRVLLLHRRVFVDSASVHFYFRFHFGSCVVPNSQCDGVVTIYFLESHHKE